MLNNQAFIRTAALIIALMVTASSAGASEADLGMRLGADIYDAGASHRVGIGTEAPKATLDINGTAKLALNSRAPLACDAAHQGTLALTHHAALCVCDTENAWINVATGSACAW